MSIGVSIPEFLSEQVIAPCPVLGLGDEWPDSVVLLAEVGGARHVCYYVEREDTHGVMCFRSVGAAQMQAAAFAPGHPAFAPVEMSFDDAREVAKAKGNPVRALILYDPPAEPVVHYVR